MFPTQHLITILLLCASSSSETEPKILLICVSLLPCQASSSSPPTSHNLSRVGSRPKTSSIHGFLRYFVTNWAILALCVYFCEPAFVVPCFYIFFIYSLSRTNLVQYLLTSILNMLKLCLSRVLGKINPTIHHPLGKDISIFMLLNFRVMIKSAYALLRCKTHHLRNQSHESSGHFLSCKYNPP